MKATAAGPHNGTPVDLAVIGGGITGAGVARLAARRGLSVALIERRDLMSGASSASSHMLHGGLRYLEQGRIGLVREALRERATVSRMAPSLARPVRFVVPLYRGDRVEPWKLNLGLTGYDLLAGRDAFAPHAMTRASDALSLEPGLAPAGLRGAGLYTDVVMDDAQLGVAVARDAAAHGATVRTWTEVTNVRPVADARELMLRDAITGTEDVLAARNILIAAGAWTDELRRRITPGIDPRLPPPSPLLRPSRGTHLLYPPITKGHGLVLLAREDGRVFFVIPFAEHALVGTTEVEVPSPPPPSAFAADLDELRYLREGLERVLPSSAGVRPRSVMAGLRPLVRAEGPAGELSREHLVIEENGTVVVAGGKYTTFRVMARDALARVLARQGQTQPRIADPATPLPAPLAGDPPLEKRVEWAVREAFARRLSDVMRRRTTFWLSPDRGLATAPAVAKTMAGLLDWSPERERSEIIEWDLAVHAEDRLIDQAGWPA
jgi:glycerol-3-phosphate dehydrogenase